MRSHKPLPSASILWELFQYDPLQGVLINRLPRGSRAQLGAIAGCIDVRSGYTTVDIKGEKYLVHRLIYKWVTGVEPVGVIDHRGQEGVKPKYNAFHALDLVTYRENSCRGKARIKKTGLPAGVWRRGAYYVAETRVQSLRIRLGCYDCPLKASNAYQAASKMLTSNPGWRPTREFIASQGGRLSYSPLKGVTFHKGTGKWRAQAFDPSSRKYKHLGLFTAEQDAAQAVEIFTKHRIAA